MLARFLHSRGNDPESMACEEQLISLQGQGPEAGLRNMIHGASWPLNGQKSDPGANLDLTTGCCET